MAMWIMALRTVTGLLLAAAWSRCDVHFTQAAPRLAVADRKSSPRPRASPHGRDSRAVKAHWLHHIATSIGVELGKLDAVHGDYDYSTDFRQDHTLVVWYLDWQGLRGSAIGRRATWFGEQVQRTRDKVFKRLIAEFTAGYCRGYAAGAKGATKSGAHRRGVPGNSSGRPKP